jgi:hypothetical protein
VAPPAAALEAFVTEIHTRLVLRKFGAQLNGDVHDDAPGPCPECSHAAGCGAERLACDQFAMFVRFGGYERWRGAARQPSRGVYAMLFSDG